MSLRYIFFFVVGIDALILFTQTTQLSISYEEAKILYGDPSFLQLLSKLSLFLFGWSDFGLRFMMIILHILSVILLYEISKEYIKTQRNRLLLLLVFVLLPGVASSAVMLNSAGVIIFGLLLYIYLSKRVNATYLYLLLLLYAIITPGFVYLFLSLSIYAFYKKERFFALYGLVLYFFSSYIYGFDASGSPSGHFLDTLGVYSAIFTPIIFVYLVYTLYRRFLTDKIDLLWYVSATGFLFSMLLSFRQSITFEHFAPYLIVALPLAAQTFIYSYNVRLKEHRKAYKMAFVLSFVFLTLNSLAVFFNKELYHFVENPKKHFAYDFHVAKELAFSLKEQGFYCVSVDEKMQLRLAFYGIQKCEKRSLYESIAESAESETVTIRYRNTPLYTYSVTNINKN